MSQENQTNERELWKKISSTQGADRAETYVELGQIAYDRGDHTVSLALCQSAREIYEGLTTHVDTSKILHAFEGITFSLRRLDRDEEAAYVALDAAKLLKEDDHVAMIDQYRDAGRYFFSAGEFQKAYDCHSIVLEQVDPDLTDDSIGVDYFNCGSTLVQLKKYTEAIPLLLTARGFYKQERDPARVHDTDAYLTTCYLRLENGVEAMVYGQKTLDFTITSHNCFLEAWAHYRMGCARLLVGEIDSAEDELRHALKMNVDFRNPDWDFALQVETEIAKILIIKGRVGEADEIFRRLKNLEEIIGDDDDETVSVEERT